MDTDTMVQARPDSQIRGNVSEMERELLSHWQGVYLLALRITNDVHAAEDVVQEAYLKAFKSASKSPPDNPRTWLLCIAANLAKNFLRDKKTHDQRRLEEGMATEDRTRNDVPSDLAEALQRHYRGLEEKYRTALSLHFEQGLTFREVAAVIRAPEGTASSLITRGVKLLRENLAREGHTVAPAVLAAELQAIAAATAAPPQLLAAVQSAAAASAKAAGVASLSATVKILLAAVVAAALIAAFVRQPRPPNTQSAAGSTGPAAAPLATGADGDAAPVVTKPAFRSFDSKLHFIVYKSAPDGSAVVLGQTPCWRADGIAVPNDESWFVSTINEDSKTYIDDVLKELEQKSIPGVQFTDVVPERMNWNRLCALPDLKMLEIGGVRDEDLPQVAALAKLRMLRVRGHFSDIGLDSIKRLTKLTALSIYSDKLTDAGIEKLSALTNLESLRLDGDGGVLIAGIEKLSKLPKLKCLSIQDCDVAESEITAASLPGNLTELTLGSSRSPLTKLQELRKLFPRANVNGWAPWADADPKRTPILTEEKEVLLAVERAIQDPSTVLPAPDPEPANALRSRRISFDFVDSPFLVAVNQIASHSETRIVLDPHAPTSDLPTVNLHVTQMNCSLALDWMCRVAGMERFQCGRIIVITTNERVQKLRQSNCADYTLGVGPDEKPWTLEDTQKLAAIAKAWPVTSGYGNNGLYFYVARMSECAAVAPGKIRVRGEDVKGIESFFNDFAAIPARTVEPPVFRGIQPLLEAKAAIKHSKERSLQDAVNQLNPYLNNLLTLDQKVSADATMSDVVPPDDWPKADATVGAALCELAARTKLGLKVQENGWMLTRVEAMQDSIKYPVILDLRAALKSKISPQELHKSLENMSIPKSQSNVPPELSNFSTTVMVRGRWLAITDPWTAQRAAAIVDSVVKTGKIPTTLPVSWFPSCFEVFMSAPETNEGSKAGKQNAEGF